MELKYCKECGRALDYKQNICPRCGAQYENENNTMDIKARIDALTGAEAKAALEWAIHKARIYGSCFECDRDGECRKDDSVDCEIEYLRQALWATRRTEEKKMTEEETMRKYAEAHGCGELRMTDEHLKALMRDMGMDIPVRPLPCVRDEHRSRETWLVRDVLAKCDEERREFDAEIFSSFGLNNFCGGCDSLPQDARQRILDEWADMQVANTSAIVAIIGATQEELDGAIQRVNEKNSNRDRL